jgi:hypothetical protein
MVAACSTRSTGEAEKLGLALHRHLSAPIDTQHLLHRLVAGAGFRHYLPASCASAGDKRSHLPA